MTDFRETLRRLSVRDDACIGRVIADDAANQAASHLDAKSHAIGVAQSAGASPDEIVGCLIAVLPAGGIARVVSAAPKVGLGLGYDVDAALEAPDRPAALGG